MEIDGIDLDGLAHETKQVIFPKMVPGRMAHIDADFLAYQCSYEKKGEEKSWDDMCYNARIGIETLHRMAGAEHRTLHLTGSTSDKGGRFDIALLKEYQATRKNRDNRPRYLDRMKEYMHKELGAVIHMKCEADDGMSSSQFKAVADGQEKFSIIVSKDKDLMQVPGLHLVWETGEIINADAFGKLYFKEKSNGDEKLVGYGSKFFWAQMLMGDTADNISGLPRLCVQNKIKTCGQMTAFAMLEDCKTDKACFEMVRYLYQECGKKAKQYFKDYRDDTPITADRAFITEAQLLWMRRQPYDAQCVARWMKEKCL